MWTSYDEQFARSSVQQLLLKMGVREHTRLETAWEEASPACALTVRSDGRDSGTRSPAVGSDGPPPVTLTRPDEIWANKGLTSLGIRYTEIALDSDGRQSSKDRYTYISLRSHRDDKVRRPSSWHGWNLARSRVGRPPTRKTRRRKGRRPVLYLHVGSLWTRRAFASPLSRSHRISKAGSFIRQTPSIKYGTTFTRALFSKYVEDLHGSKRQELVVLGSSNGAIEVEAVNLDKIRNKLSRVEKLREVSLDGENVASADPSGEIGRTCPSACFRNRILFGCKVYTRSQVSAGST